MFKKYNRYLSRIINFYIPKKMNKGFAECSKSIDEWKNLCGVMGEAPRYGVVGQNREEANV